MTLAVFYKLLAIFLTVGLGFTAARLRWLGAATPAAARIIGALAFNLFMPALLFRAAARLDFARVPWHTVAAFYVPVLAVLLGTYLWQRRRARRDRPARPAAPAVGSVAAVYGNAVQLGIPLSAALFGETGLAIHVALVSIHALVLLPLPTTLAELDMARAHAQREGAPSLGRVLLSTLRNTVIHPVVLPVLAGIAWNLGGLGLHPVLDEVLLQLGSAAVPLCLVLIGVTLQAYGLAGRLHGALATCVAKLLVLPAVVLLVAHWGFGLSGTPLAVAVMMAALPVGSNALIFAQRYETLEAEATTAIVVSTLAFVFSASLWLGVLAWIGAAAR